MKGNTEVVDTLNKLLAGELAARDQYFVHGLIYDEWGYRKLHTQAIHEAEHETQHAAALVRRILLLKGTPTSTPTMVNIGSDVFTMLKNDLNLEYKVRDNLKAAIKLCEDKQDYVSRDMLVQQLLDTEEDHAHWLEQQLALIEAMGLENYLQSSISGDA